MTQLRLVWSFNGSQISLLDTKKKPAKCLQLRTTCTKSQRAWKKFERLQRERPIAAAVIERLVDKALQRRAG